MIQAHWQNPIRLIRGTTFDTVTNVTTSYLFSGSYDTNIHWRQTFHHSLIVGHFDTPRSDSLIVSGISEVRASRLENCGFPLGIHGSYCCDLKSHYRIWQLIISHGCRPPACIRLVSIQITQLQTTFGTIGIERHFRVLHANHAPAGRHGSDWLIGYGDYCEVVSNCIKLLERRLTVLNPL